MGLEQLLLRMLTDCREILITNEEIMKKKSQGSGNNNFLNLHGENINRITCWLDAVIKNASASEMAYLSDEQLSELKNLGKTLSFICGENIENIIKYNEKLAQQSGMVLKQNYDMAVNYFLGIPPFKKDVEKAKNLYEKIRKDIRHIERGKDTSQLAQAYEVMGLIYYNGHFEKQDYDEAFKWFNKFIHRVRSGNVSIIHFYMGNIYKAKKEYSKALEQFRQAGEKNPLALYEIAALYENGIDAAKSSQYKKDSVVIKDMQQALVYYDKAVNCSESETLRRIKIDAKYCMAKILDQMKQYSRAMVIYKEVVDDDLKTEFKGQACFKLGMYYELGLGGAEPNLMSAETYYMLASDCGNVQALLKLGQYYIDAQQYKEAFTYYSLAAEKGSIKANYCLANCYERGIGTEANHEKAMQCYELTAIDYADAAYHLGEISKTPKLRHQYFIQAIKLFKQELADSEIDLSRRAHIHFKLGLCYENSQGVIANNREALKHYMRAAEGKYPSADEKVNLLELNLQAHAKRFSEENNNDNQNTVETSGVNLQDQQIEKFKLNSDLADLIKKSLKCKKPDEYKSYYREYLLSQSKLKQLDVFNYSQFLWSKAEFLRRWMRIERENNKLKPMTESAYKEARHYIIGALEKGVDYELQAMLVSARYSIEDQQKKLNDGKIKHKSFSLPKIRDLPNKQLAPLKETVSAVSVNADSHNSNIDKTVVEKRKIIINPYKHLTHFTQYKFEITLPEEIVLILNQLRSTQKPCYLYGEIIRNSYLHKYQNYITDLNFADLITGNTIEEIEELVKSNPLVKNLEKISNNNIQLIVLTLQSGQQLRVRSFSDQKYAFDITSLATDSEATAFSHELLILANLVAQEKYTIDTLCYDFNNQILIDFNNIKGKSDLEDGIIKLVGDDLIKRIEQRAVLLFDIIILANKLNFALDPKTQEALLNCGYLVKTLAKDLLYQQVINLFSQGVSIQIYNSLINTGLFQHLFPRVASYQHNYPADTFFTYLLQGVFAYSDNWMEFELIFFAGIFWGPLGENIFLANHDINAGVNKTLNEIASNFSVPKEVLNAIRLIWVAILAPMFTHDFQPKTFKKTMESAKALRELIIAAKYQHQMYQIQLIDSMLPENTARLIAQFGSLPSPKSSKLNDSSVGELSASDDSKALSTAKFNYN